MSDVAESPVQAIISISEGAKLAGVARSTVNRKIKAGELSRAQGGGVQIAELERVFGKLQDPSKLEREEVEQGGALGHFAPSDAPSHATDVPRWLVDQLERLQDQNDALLERLAEKDRVLQEAEERAERREQVWRTQLDKVTMLLPPPPATPEPPRSFWSRMFG